MNLVTKIKIILLFVAFVLMLTSWIFYTKEKVLLSTAILISIGMIFSSTSLILSFKKDKT